MRIEENYSLKNYNTFAIDCRCKYFIESDNEADFLEMASSYELLPEELLILGGGSNLLLTEYFDGTVLFPRMQGIEILTEDNNCVDVRVGAGVVWDDFVSWAVEKGLGGVENLSGIPGRVGASPVQNVGAYGMEAGGTIVKVEAIDLEYARKVTIDAAQCRFAYRDSVFKHEWKNKYIITYVVFRLNKRPVFCLEYGNIKSKLEALGQETTLAAVRRAVLDIRNEKLPDVSELPNAGSFFKNPVVSEEVMFALREKYPQIPFYPVDEGRVKLAAGWLIEQSGWKGRREGNAGVYEKQALVLVNYGGATGIEITRLANEIKKSVFILFGVWLEPEVNIK